MKKWFKKNKDAILIAGAISLMVFAMSTEERIPEAIDQETESDLIQWKQDTETQFEVTIEPTTNESVAEPEEIETTTEMETEDEVIFYDVPLSEELQLHIIAECEKYSISPAIVIAMIERESNFRSWVIGDNGDSYGLMQIKPKYQKERMDKLGCNDLLDAFQNVTVGVDILAEKICKYQSVEKALTAYNAGDTGAREHYFSKGIYANKYARGVLRRADELERAVEYGY